MGQPRIRGQFRAMRSRPPPDGGGTTLTPEQVLCERFGYPAFRPGQRELVDAALSGRDAIGVLPTGGGKTLCYQVPSVLLPGVTVVMSPLVSLMEDQLRRARAAGVAAVALHSGLPAEERSRVEAELLGGCTRLLLLAPERLQNDRFRALLPRLHLSLLAVDEAHCISTWGHDFRPAYRAIGLLRDTVTAPVLALTATATPRVRKDIEESLRMREPVRVVGSFDRPNLLWAVHRVRSLGDKLPWIRGVLRRYPGARLVYASTRRRVDTIRNDLARHGQHAEAYHAGLPPGERTRVQAYFLTDSAPVVVATNAFGMGIDRADVRLVVHDQLSGSLEDYYQEAGRAGRDGALALCVAMHYDRDSRVHRAFLNRTHPPVRGLCQAWRLARERGLGRRLELRRSGRRKLEAIRRYATARGCRRRLILEWFGERRILARCGGCDRCLGWSGVVRRLATR